MNGLQDAANQMIRLQPGSPEGYALRALANINGKHYTEAEQDIRRAIAAAPQSAYGYVQMGNLRLAQKQYSDAAKAYQDALDRNADSTDALRGLMNTYIAEKQIDKAIAAAKAQILKSPNNSRFYEPARQRADPRQERPRRSRSRVCEICCARQEQFRCRDPAMPGACRQGRGRSGHCYWRAIAQGQSPSAEPLCGDGESV